MYIVSPQISFVVLFQGHICITASRVEIGVYFENSYAPYNFKHFNGITHLWKRTSEKQKSNFSRDEHTGASTFR